MKLTEQDRQDIAFAVAVESEDEDRLLRAVKRFESLPKYEPKDVPSTLSFEERAAIWKVNPNKLEKLMRGRALIRKLRSIT